MITDTAADGVEFIFGTAFKEDMQDEMTITVIAAGFEDTDAPAVEEAPAADEAATGIDDIIPIDNPLVDGLGFGSNEPKPVSSSTDYDLDDILKILGN